MNEALPVPALPAWLTTELPFRRRVIRAGGHRIHLIDDGAGPPVVLLHGNPTWCYLWRKVIRRLLPHRRVIAPDLFGLGLSDKPRRPSAHQLARHVDCLAGVIEALGLQDLTLVGQDWGGPIACGLGERHPDLVHGLVLANTAVLAPRRPLRPKAFHRFSHTPLVSDLVFRLGGFPLPVLHRVQGDPRSIGPQQHRAYAWPLRRPWDRAAPLGLARMVPNRERHPSTAEMDRIGAWVATWRGPAALVWGVRDPLLGRALPRLAEALPQASVVETEAGHFLQEEVPGPLAEAIFAVSEGARPAPEGAHR